MRRDDVDDDLRSILDREPCPYGTEPDGIVRAACAALVALALFAGGTWCALRLAFGAAPPPLAEGRTP